MIFKNSFQFMLHNTVTWSSREFAQAFFYYRVIVYFCLFSGDLDIKSTGFTWFNPPTFLCLSKSGHRLSLASFIVIVVLRCLRYDKEVFHIVVVVILSTINYMLLFIMKRILEIFGLSPLHVFYYIHTIDIFDLFI